MRVQMSFYLFHTLDWTLSDISVHPSYVTRGYELFLPPNILNTDTVADLEQWLLKNCRSDWNILTCADFGTERMLCDYENFIRFEDEVDFIIAKMSLT